MEMNDDISKHLQDPIEDNVITSNIESFNIQLISLKIQDKLIEHLPKNALKLMMDKTSARLFENIYKVIGLYTENLKYSADVTKQAVKCNVQLLLLVSNDLLNDDELNLVSEFHDMCYRIGDSVLRLGWPKRRALPGPKPSFEDLINLIKKIGNLLTQILGNHFCQNSKEKLSNFIDLFSQQKFIYEVFTNTTKYGLVMHEIYEDLEDMIDRGII